MGRAWSSVATSCPTRRSSAALRTFPGVGRRRPRRAARRGPGRARRAAPAHPARRARSARPLLGAALARAACTSCCATCSRGWPASRRRSCSSSRTFTGRTARRATYLAFFARNLRDQRVAVSRPTGRASSRPSTRGAACRRARAPAQRDPHRPRAADDPREVGDSSSPSPVSPSRASRPTGSMRGPAGTRSSSRSSSRPAARSGPVPETLAEAALVRSGRRDDAQHLLGVVAAAGGPCRPRVLEAVAGRQAPGSAPRRGRGPRA